MSVAGNAAPALRVDALRTVFETRRATLTAVDGVSFAIAPGEIHGLVGESGSGKSITAFSIMGLLDPPGRVAGGIVSVAGRTVLDRTPDQLRAMRGREISMIFQDPMMTLNPMLSIRSQMVDAVLAHDTVSPRDAAERAVQALRQVGIPSPGKRLDAYPHQFSGGMRQRVAIAIALINRPRVVLADEPTTALDVTIQAQILFEVRKLARDSATAFLWISHDLSVVSGLADTISVMYMGRIVEQGPADAVLEHPRHPYTRGLIDSLPAMNPRGKPLRQIPGMAPPLDAIPPGCAFAPRCDRATPACSVTVPRLEPMESGQSVRCFHPVPLTGDPARGAMVQP